MSNVPLPPPPRAAESPSAAKSTFKNRFLVDDFPGGDNSRIVMNPEAIESLGLFQEDYVRLKGRFNKHTYAIVQSSPDCDPTRIRMNRVIRKNLGVNLSDVVVVRPCPDLPYSKRIKILPFRQDLEGLRIAGYTAPDPSEAEAKGGANGAAAGGNDAAAAGAAGSAADSAVGGDGPVYDLFDLCIVPYFKNKCRPVAPGDTFVVTTTDLPTNRDIEFKVVMTDPADGCIVMDGGEIFYQGEAIDRDDWEKENSLVGYSDLGGLGREIAQIRELVELPLRHPELFKKLGMKPPRGILLHGPAGCGKTTIGKAIANESGAFFFLLNGSEIMGSVVGESEKNLRKAFELCEEEAQKQGAAILFIDEIDALAAKREESKGEVEKRVVSQLLTLMDGIKPRSNIIVIAATNRPNAIDPALRRFGRFDREIVINVPDERGRLEILNIHTRKLRLHPDGVDLEKIAQRTHGFVGADLAQLCTEAGMTCIRESMEALLDMEADEPIGDDILNQIYVTENHFLEALSKISPSTLRDTIVEIPTTTWDDIGGLETTKRELVEMIQYPIMYKEKYEKLGIQPSHGALLWGPPGVGKSLLAKAIANECKCNYISIKGPELMSMWVGESEHNIRNIFDKARQAAPCVLFFDEIESFTRVRGSGLGGGSEVGDRMLNQLLTEMDGVGARKDVFIVGATNRPDVIDSALMRPGRLDQLIYIPLPDEAARVAILQAHVRKSNVDYSEVSLEDIAAVTEGYSGADLAEICSRACKYSIRGGVDSFNKKMKALNKMKRDLVEKGTEITPKMEEELRAREEAIDSEFGSICIRGIHFEQAVRESRKSVSEEEMRRFDAFKRQYSGGVGDGLGEADEANRRNVNPAILSFRFSTKGQSGTKSAAADAVGSPSSSKASAAPKAPTSSAPRRPARSSRPAPKDDAEDDLF